MPRVSIIILNWNGKQFLDTCLGALEAQTFRDFETILVDNGSSDGSVDYVRERYPWIRVLALPENAGFAEGNNLGFRESSGEFVVTLNNDTMAAADFLGEMVNVMEADTKVGMAAAKMLNFYETSRIDSVGIQATTAGIGVNRGVGETDIRQYDTSDNIFGPCAGAALYRRSMIEEIGFFDLDFFAYYEDLDLAWRARLAGWKAVTAPMAVVYHMHSATAGRMSDFTVFHTHRNKWYVIIKNWPFDLIIRYLPLLIAYDAAAILLAAIKGRTVPAFRARLNVVSDFPLLFRKRRMVRKLQKIMSIDIQPLLTPAASPLKILRRKMGSGV